METGLSAMLAEIVAMEERKQALLEELNELDQRLFKAKSKWVCAPQTRRFGARSGRRHAL
jgi:Tfp pilus assembly protein PilN